MSSTVQDDSSAATILGLSISLQLITAFLVGVRIKTRIQNGNSLQSHDWAILLAELLSFPQIVFVVNATLNGYGRHEQFVTYPHITEAMRSIFMAQVTFYWSTTFVKISVVCLLMSLKRTSRGWTIFFYVSMSILLCALIPITATQFLACQPFSAYWDAKIRQEAVCWPPQMIFGNVVAFSAIQAAADLVFSFIPLTFLLKLNQPLRERIAISILMGLGLFASGTAIARTIIGVIPRPDMFRTDADITLLSLVDLHVGIIAATLPTLKVFFQSIVVNFLQATASEGSEEEVRGTLCNLGLLDKSYYPDGSKSGQEKG